MNTKGKEFVVSVADFAFYINGVLACTGVTNLSSSISVSMQEQAVNAGKGNKKVFSYKYGRELTAELEAADWKLEYIALQAGSQISKGLKDSYSLNECVTLVAGKGTIDHTPLTGAKVGVELPNGTFVEVTADGTSIDLTSYGLTTEKVKCTYQYNAISKRITIDAESTPYIGKGAGKTGKQLNKYVLYEFKKYLDLWMEQRKKQGIESEWLFVHRCGDGSYAQMKVSTLDSWANIFSNELGVDFYWHCMRHYLNTKLLKLNIPANVVQEFFGWSSSDMVNLYNDSEVSEEFSKYFTKDGIVEGKSSSLSDL